MNASVVTADAGTTLSLADEAVVYGAAFLLPLAATLLLTPAAAGIARRLGVLTSREPGRATLSRRRTSAGRRSRSGSWWPA